LRDVSKEILEIANNYHFTKTPEWLEDGLRKLGNFWRVLWEWLKDQLTPSGGNLDSSGVSTILQNLIYLVAAAGIVWLCIVMWKRVRTPAGALGNGTRGASAVEELLDSSGWQRQAEALANKGDYKGACRAIYLSLLQQLHENEIAVFAPAKTNYEYSYTLAKYPAIQAAFKDLAERVEVIWFGNKEATGDDYTTSKTQLVEMDPEIRRIGAAKAENKLAQK
jgi:hypothetical protein